MFRSDFYVPSTITYIDDDNTKKVFIFHEELGHGGFAVVYRVTLQNTSKTFAMKVISKERYARSQSNITFEKLHNEIDIQKSLNHPNIVQSKYSFSDESNYYIVLEYCPGKSVHELLNKSELYRLSEPEIRKILNDVLQGLIYIQNRQIIHHDLKLDNFLIGADGKVKIADFGLATVLHHSEQRQLTVCGTTNYLSPELLRIGSKGHGYEVDIWAVGVAAFIMLTGRGPFDGGSKDATFENIRNCNYRFPSKIPISYEAKDFINSIFQVDVRRRATAIDLVDHPFLANFDSEDEGVCLYKQPVKRARKIVDFQKNTSPHEVKNKFTSPHQPSKFTSPAKTKKINNFERPNINSKANLIPSNINIRSINANRAHSVSNRRPNFNNNVNIGVNKVNFRNGEENKQSNKPLSKQDNDFNLLKTVVTMYYIHNKDLGYLIGDGTVGVCFDDFSRIVMDPNESFVQYYKDCESPAEVINIISSDKHKKKISFVQKLARSFKKIRSLYEIKRGFYSSSIPLRNVKYFVKNGESILFKFSDKNIQANFNDNKKMIILMDMNKLALFNDFNEKCNLIDMGLISGMNSNSDIRKRFVTTKEMLGLLYKKLKDAI